MRKGKLTKSRVRFKIKGLNQERVLNKLTSSVNIYNFKRTSHDLCEFEVDYSKERIVKSRLLDCNVEIVESHRFGWISKIKQLFSSYGIIIALCLSFMFYCLQYSFIWKIEVYGEEKLQEKEVELFVVKNLTSRLKSQIDTKGLEKKIKNNFDEVSSISVAIVGQSLVLNINEALLPEEMQGEYLPIVSEFDGLITQINLIQGTLAVNEGDLVRKGDVLVYPFVLDSQGYEIAVAPKAEIYADIWLIEKVMHYDYQIIERKTGKKHIKNEVFLNNLLVYSQNSTILFDQYDIETEDILLTKNLCLPFILKKTIYYETQTVEIKEEFADVKNKIIQSAREKTLIFLEENEIIKEEKYTLREEGGCHEISYIVTVNRNIGG